MIEKQVLFETVGDAVRYCATHGLTVSHAAENLFEIAEALHRASNAPMFIREYEGGEVDQVKEVGQGESEAIAEGGNRILKGELITVGPYGNLNPKDYKGWIEMNSDIFGEYAREGSEAYENGLKMSDCPYSKGSDECMAWESGFDVAGLESQHRSARASR